MKKLSYLPLLVFLSTIPFLNAQVLNAQVWTLAGPSSRHSHTAVFDPSSAQMIIFGGEETASNTNLNDVWLGVTSAQQDDRFIQVLPTGTAPQGRYGHVATYDPNTNRMTIFGGALGSPSPCANDVWLLDGANGRGECILDSDNAVGNAAGPASISYCCLRSDDRFHDRFRWQQLLDRIFQRRMGAQQRKWGRRNAGMEEIVAVRLVAGGTRELQCRLRFRKQYPDDLWRRCGWNGLGRRMGTLACQWQWRHTSLDEAIADWNSSGCAHGPKRDLR